jgi:hypothetical protein
MQSWRLWASKAAIFLSFPLILGSVASKAFAYSPEDPEVRAMVEKGVAYLEGLPKEDLNLMNYGDPEGQPMLIAYAILKANGDTSAPLVQYGIENAVAYAKKIQANASRSREHGHKSVYEMSVAIMLLAEVDPTGYASEIKTLADELLSEQMSHGGYGYHGEPHGDTSQVQYVSLAMWTLDRIGFDFDYERSGRLIGWIVRTQDPSGFWTYKPQDPGGSRGLVKQNTNQMTISTCLAAGSALLITADVLRQWGNTEGMSVKIDGLPKALKQVVTDPTAEQKRNAIKKQAAKVPADAIRGSIGRLEQYRAQNPFRRTGAADWYYYMMYTLERYESFLELAKPGSKPSNAWYDEGVTALMKLQDGSGSWGKTDASYSSAPVSTAFAILFLIRSTKKSIAKASSGAVAGGFGLPKDTSKIVVSGTQIKGEPTAEAVTDLLSLLEADAANPAEPKSIPDDMKLETDPQRRRQQLDRLERLVRGSQSWQSRRVAAKLLGKSDELSVVPALIFALSDPDTVVRRSAVDGLRFISRKFDEVDLPDKPSPEEIRKAQKQWRDWYLTIYPGYTFLDGF